MAINGVHRIPRISSITKASPSDCLVSFLGRSLEPYPYAEMQSVYSTATADWDGSTRSPINPETWWLKNLQIDWSIDFTACYQEVRESHSLYIHIYIFFFVLLFLEKKLYIDQSIRNNF